MKHSIRQIWKTCMFLVLSILMTIGINQVVFAADEGTMLSNAVRISFNQHYVKTWTTTKNHLNHYCKITVPEKGIVTVNATKPYDSEGEYGAIYFTLYTEENTAIWNVKSSESKKTASDSYKYSIGLNPGVYYMTFLPGFTVTSGVISTTYSFSFTPDAYCEIEPNGSLAQATIMQLGQVYTGFIGDDYGSPEDDDFWRFSLEAGQSYKIAVGNYSMISSTTAIIQGLTPDGDRISLSKLENLVDEDGMNYILYTAQTDGMHALKVYNYSKQPFKYTVSVTKKEKKDPKLTVPSTNITKLKSDPKFSLGATAATALSYSCSNTSVCSVVSDGTVYIWKTGTADITITAKETDVYKGASAVVRITVVDKLPTPQNPDKPTVQEKKAQPMTVSVKTVSVKKKAVAKKKQVIAKAKVFTVKNAQGNVSFKKISGAKQVSVSSGGKITVKKGTKKGNYKIRVAVTATGNSQYKSGQKIVNVKVKVK